MKTTQPSKLETEAMALFAVAKVDGISTVLWALGLREPCGRCGGSGHYSRNSMGDTRCYDCKGRRERAAKLTRKTLEQARVKVEAGELVAARARGAAKVAARKAIAGKIAAAEPVYREIADAYTRGSRAIDRGDYHEGYQAQLHAFVTSPLFRVNSLNGDLFYGECSSRAFKREPGRGMHSVKRAVEFDGLDPVRACAELDALHVMLVQLRDAWRAWETSQRAALRASSHARLAA